MRVATTTASATDSVWLCASVALHDTDRLLTAPAARDFARLSPIA